MYEANRKRSFDIVYGFILLLLFGTTVYFLNIPMWSDISKSNFPLSSHIQTRLAYVWHVFWPAIIAAILYPFAKVGFWGSSWERKILIPWKLFTLVIIGVIWWAFLYGS